MEWGNIFFKKNLNAIFDFSSPTTDISSLFRSSVKQRGYTIDTSRAKTNAHVVSLCAQKLNIDEVSYKI